MLISFSPMSDLRINGNTMVKLNKLNICNMHIANCFGCSQINCLDYWAISISHKVPGSRTTLGTCGKNTSLLQSTRPRLILFPRSGGVSHYNHYNFMIVFCSFIFFQNASQPFSTPEMAACMRTALLSLNV